jgi:hypothetical protein
VHHQVHLTALRRLQRKLQVGEKVRPTATSLDARAHWQVKAQVGIGYKEYA